MPAKNHRYSRAYSQRGDDRLLQREAPKSPPSSRNRRPIGILDVAGTFIAISARGWDLERRLQDMAASKVMFRLFSVCPQTFLYGQPPALATCSPAFRTSSSPNW